MPWIPLSGRPSGRWRGVAHSNNHGPARRRPRTLSNPLPGDSRDCAYRHDRTLTYVRNRSVAPVCGTHSGIGRRVNLRSGERERGRAEVGGGGPQHRGERLEIAVRGVAAQAACGHRRGEGSAPGSEGHAGPAGRAGQSARVSRGRRRRVRLAQPHVHTGTTERLPTFLPLPPSYRGCRPFWDVLPEVMSTIGDRV